MLFRVTLPLLLPALGAAAGLAVALSMGELGATVMVYPATWKTLPVTIFALTDRGQAFQAAACTTILLLVTLRGAGAARSDPRPGSPALSVFPAELDIPGASWGTQKSPDTNVRGFCQ